MIVKICSIRDKVANEHFGVHVAKSFGVAERQFLDALKKEKPFCDHPDDYDLWFIAEFDTEEGRIVGLDTPRIIVDGAVVAQVAQSLP